MAVSTNRGSLYEGSYHSGSMLCAPWYNVVQRLVYGGFCKLGSFRKGPGLLVGVWG